MASPIDPLPVERLRWRCDSASLGFETTDDIDPVVGVIGQESAVQALTFGLESDAPGQNVFVRGLTGTGRMTLVGRLLERHKPPCSAKRDRCYVHNFVDPDRPRLISLPPGRAREFRRRLRRLREFILERLPEALKSGPLKARRDSFERRANERMRELMDPFDKRLREAGLALVSIQMGPLGQTAIFPRIEGRAVPPDELEQLRAEGRLSEAEFAEIERKREGFSKELEGLSEQVRRIRRETEQSIQYALEETAGELLRDATAGLLADFPGDDVRAFIEQLVHDVIEERLLGSDAEPDPSGAKYGVNVLVEHASDPDCPVVVENTPTLANLLGTVERNWSAQGPERTDFRMIRAGSLLRSDGGYLVLDARDVLTEPGAWKVLVRTLRTGKLEIVPSELHSPFWYHSIKPEPIPVEVRVILVGDASIYHMLDAYDPDFPELFKVLADFDSLIDRAPDGVRQYAGVLARIAREEQLPAFHRDAVAALAEHGARIAARRGKLSARFARIADIAREAAYLSRKAEAGHVRGEHVRDAVRRTKARADLPSRRFRELLSDGTIRVQTRGSRVGQINGLAVLRAGFLTYGFPARITASIGAGTAGIIDIEGQAALSGAIHTKGFHILGGLLRRLLRTDHPLAFSASLAFEQSYGGIDGDSASAAEICCLLSALTDIPLRQEIAITGAIDQLGHVQAVGGVDEKVEGFFDTCADAGLTGEQGVIIPEANADDLMLRQDVVDACADGRFQVWAVSSVHEALELLTSVPAGERGADGSYPEGSLLACAVDKARDYWLRSLRGPLDSQHE